MEIVVLIKMVAGISFDAIWEEKAQDRLSGDRKMMNPADACALEAALRLRDTIGGRITVLSMGPDGAEDILRDCLARGADRGVHLCGRQLAGADTLMTARALAAAIRKDGLPELILCGRKAIDSETGHIGPQVAELLNAVCIPDAIDLRFTEDGQLAVTALSEHETQRMLVSFPAVVTACNFINVPHQPTIMGMRAAKKKELLRITPEELGLSADLCSGRSSPTEVQVVEQCAFPGRHSRRILGAEHCAEVLCGLLTESGVTL